MKSLSDYVVRLHCPKKKCKDTYHSITDIDFSCKDCEEDKWVADIYEKGWASEYIAYCICHGEDVGEACSSDIFEVKNMREKCDSCRGEFKLFNLYKIHAE